MGLRVFMECIPNVPYPLFFMCSVVMRTAPEVFTYVKLFGLLYVCYWVPCGCMEWSSKDHACVIQVAGRNCLCRLVPESGKLPEWKDLISRSLAYNLR